ncbi:MAG: cadherin-like beta sandwich domain-containing protein [Bacteroidota bacterium]
MKPNATHILLLAACMLASVTFINARSGNPVSAKTGDLRGKFLPAKKSATDHQKPLRTVRDLQGKNVLQHIVADIETAAGIKPTATAYAAPSTPTNCVISRDLSWTLLASCDDCSTQLNLGFDFNFNGVIYDKVYINTNGTLSFGTGITAYVPSVFPLSPSLGMPPVISPFWADVDTRFQLNAACATSPVIGTQTGQIYYKLEATRLTVLWENVQHYTAITTASPCPPVNTFQVVISTLNDPMVGVGKNILFNYGEMGWVFGDVTVGSGAVAGYDLTNYSLFPYKSGAPSNSNPIYQNIGYFNANTTIGAPGVNNVHAISNKCYSFNISSVPSFNYIVDPSYPTGAPVYLAPVSTGGEIPAIPFGQATSFAGLSSTVSGSVNGIGTAASFNNPNGVSVSKTGDIYVADQANQLIRKITSAGVVTTLAGTTGVEGSVNATGTAATFNNPAGIVFDNFSLTNIYVSDQGNNKIRKIATATGVVTTLAGTGVAGATDGGSITATFNAPAGIATDYAGNVYVADKGNHKIRKITAAGVVSTIAGSALSGTFNTVSMNALSATFNSPTGIAVDNASDTVFIYVVDSANNAIRKIKLPPVASNATITTLDSGLNKPSGITIDGANNLYITEQGSNLVKMYIEGKAPAIIVAGTGSSGAVDSIGNLASFNYPAGIAADVSTVATSLFIADRSNNKIRKVAVTGYRADSGFPLILKLDGASGIISGILKPSTAGTTDTAVVYGFNNAGYAKDSVIIKVEIGAPDISYTDPVTVSGVATMAPLTPSNVGGPVPALRYGQTFTFAGSGSIGALNNASPLLATFNKPRGIAQDIAGNLFIADSANNVIRKISPTGIVSNYAGSGTAGFADSSVAAMATFRGPSGVAVDVAGNVYVADAGNNKIRKISTTGVVSTYAGSGTQSGSADNAVANLATFNRPLGLAIDERGNLYVADAGNNKIRKISTTGIVSTYAGSGTQSGSADNSVPTLATFNAPSGLAIDVMGNVFVADQGNHKIRKITPTGVVTSFAGSGTGTVDGVGTAASFKSPSGIAFDIAGNLFVADQGNHKIRKITPTGLVTSLAGSGTGGSADNIKGSLSSFNFPTALVVGDSGRIYVADENNHKIRRITPLGYTITPAISPGLQFDSTTGTVSGKPVTFAPLTYAVTAYNQFGSSTDSLEIRYTSSETKLASLVSVGQAFSPTVPLTPIFSSVVLSYASSVTTLTPYVTLTATALQMSSTINIGIISTTGAVQPVPISLTGGITGITATGSVLSMPITLTNGGITRIAIKVTSENGLFSTTYVYTVTSVLSADPRLSNIDVSALTPVGTLSPVFAPGVVNYTAIVPTRTFTTTIGATTLYPFASVSINGQSYKTGNDVAVVPLSFGNNVFPIIGKAEAGLPGLTYSLTILRPLSTNKDLSSLVLSSGALSPTFSGIAYPLSPATTSYTAATVPFNTATVTLTPTLVDTPYSSVKINGIAVTSGVASAPISLNVGITVLTTVVTAQDGSIRTYTITIMRLPAPTANITGTISTCLGTTAPVVTFTGAVGAAPFTFTYKVNGGPDQTITSSAFTATVSVPTNAVATYVFSLVSVEDAAHSSQPQTGSATVTVNGLPDVINISGIKTICSGTSTQLSPTGSFNSGSAVFKWYDASTNGNLVGTGVLTTPALTSTTSYFVDVTNSTTGCASSSRADVEVVVNPLPTINSVTGSLTICEGTSTTLTASSDAPAPTFRWYRTLTGGTQFGTGATINTGILTGTTTFYVEAESNGCTSAVRTPVTVTVNPLAIINAATNSVSCPGGNDGSITVNVTSGTAPYQYSKDGGLNFQGSNVFAGLTAGTYSIVVKSSTGCSSIAQPVTVATVPDITKPVPNITNLPVITGQCSAAITTVPTATDNCVGIVTGTTSDPVSYSTQGTYAVTWSYNDGHGNTATQTQTVIVRDVAPPVITVPATIAVNNDAGKCAAAITVTAPAVNDNCAVVSLVGVRSDGLLLTADYPAGNTVITWTATDIAGNTSSLAQTVTVTDNEPPVVHTQNIIVQLGTNGTATITPAQINNGSTDNCGIGTMVLGKTTFNCSNIGTNTVTLTVTDIHGNASGQTATVTVQDNIAPTVITQNIIVQLGTNGTATITPAQINNGSTDNCSIATYSLDKTTFNCSNVGLNTVILTVTDVNGNAANATATVTVQDNIVPTVLTQNIIVQLDANGTASITPAQINNGSSDNCTIATYSLNKTIFNCSNVGLNTVVLAVTDVNGNVSTGTAAVTVRDNIAPTVTTQNITVQLGANGSVAITPAQINNGSTDNCSIATYALDKTTFDCSNVGLNTVILTVTDVNGNVSTGTATVTVQDNIAPIVVAQNISVQLGINGTATITPAQVNNGSTDNCSIATYSLDKTTFNCSNVGLNTVILTVTDVNGNVSAAPATVTVQDNIAPTVITQNITILLNASGSVSISTAQINNGSTDNCSIATYALDKTTFDCSNVGLNTVTLTVTDMNGNVSTGTATVTVQDNIAPTVITQNITVQLDVNGSVTITPAQINNGSSDNCSIAVYSLDKTAFDCSHVGLNTVILTVTDVNGNVSMGTATVTVQDNIAPTVITQNITVQLDENGSVTITPAQVNNVSSDNCSIATYSIDKTTFDCSNVGLNTVILTVTDINGNVTAAQAKVTVQDNTAPTVVTQNITIQLDANGSASITTAQINNGSTDNCSIATYELDKTTFDCSNVGLNTVILTVTDVNGNISTGTATVTVQDNIAPAVVTQNITVQLGANGSVTITPAQINNGSTDNCSIATYALDKATFDCNNVGLNTVTLTVTDANGNVSIGPAIVTVRDNIAPTVITQNITAQLDATGSVTITPDQINNGSTDNCSIATYSLDKTTFNCSNIGLNAVILTVTDVNGNVSAAPATVTVQDNIAPTVITQNITIQLNAGGSASIATAQINNGSTDNCSIATYALDKTTFDCSNVGLNTVVLTVTDVNGNVSTGTATVTVQDNIAPIVVTQNITVQLDANGSATITPAQINNGSTDNCSIATYSLDKTTFNCSNVGLNSVILTLTDVNGNVSAAPATVTVQDNIAPTVITQNITIQLDASGSAGITAVQINNGSSDNCSIATYSLDKTTFNCSNTGVNTVTLTVTDVNGNVSTATAMVTVQDNMAPTVITQNIVIYLDANGTASITPAQINNGSTDNCSIATYNLSKAIFDCNNTGSNTVTLTVTDVSGNSSSNTAIVTVRDTIAPVVSAAPANITVECSAIPAAAILTATDNCSVVSLVMTEVRTNGSCPNNYTLKRTWTATDPSGNHSSVCQVITVEDHSAPVLSAAPADITVECNTIPAAAILTATDNCETPAVVYTEVRTDGSNPSNYTLTRIWTAMDACGNTSSKTQVITVHDVTAPVIICPAPVTLNCQDNNTSAATGVATATDNCTASSSIAITQSDVSTYSADPSNMLHYNYTISRTWRATDISGNYSECVQLITVRDITKPIITVPSAITLNCQDNTAPANTGTATGTDICSPVTITYSDASTQTASLTDAAHYNYVITRTWTATDVTGNYISGVQTITVRDITKPVITLPSAITLNCQDNTAPANTGTATGTDICSPVTITYSDASTQVASLTSAAHYNYTITRTWTATDVTGNYISGVQIITVRDITKPIITVPSAITLNCQDNTAPVNTGTATGTDICSPVTITYSDASTQVASLTNAGHYNYTITRTWTATDVTGNNISGVQTITVRDITKPVIVTCPSGITQCNDQAGNIRSFNFVATDNCSPLATTYTIVGPGGTVNGTGNTITTGFAVGTTTITWTVKDVSLNSNTCTTTVVINPLPVAGITAAGADAFCNGFVLSGSSTLTGPFTYQWLYNNQNAGTTQNIILGLTNGDGVYTLFTTDGKGCRSATGAVYSYQKQNLVSSYTIIAEKEVDLGKYNKVASGSVGITSSKGEAEFKAYSSVNGAGSFVKAPKIDKDGSGIVISSQLIGIASVTLPVMQYNTVSTNNLPNYTASVNNATLTGSYKTLTVKKGISVTVTANTFGSIKLEEGASIRFTATVLNIADLVADKGAKNDAYTYIRFNQNTSVRVSGKVSIGSQVLVNPESNKVTFYMGDLNHDEEKFTVKGGDTRVIANIYMPDGKLRVTATDSDNDDHGNCDHRAHDARYCQHKNHDHNDCDHRAHSAASCNDDVYMTGLFIAEEVESKGNTVIWNSYDCSAPPPAIIVNAVTPVINSVVAEKVETKITTEEELKVTVMPNPTTTYFTLKLESKYQTPISLRVMDARGRVVDARSKISANSTIQIGHNYSSGTYYAELIQGTKHKLVQLIKGRG